MTLTLVLLGKFKVTGRKNYLIHVLSISCLWINLLSSYYIQRFQMILQVQGHWKKTFIIHAWSISFLWINLEGSSFTQRLVMTWGCVLTLTQGHCTSSRTQTEKSHNSWLVHMCLRDKHCEFPFNTKIAYDLRLCHVFELRSFMQVQGHWQKKFVSGLYIFFINLHLRFIHKNYNEQLYLHKKCFCISSLKSMEHSWFGTSEKSSGG